MTRTTHHDDDHLGDEIAREITDIEAHADDPLPPSTKITRGHARSRVLQVRLNDDELDRIIELAEQRDLPASTFARSLLLREQKASLLRSRPIAAGHSR